MHVVYRYDRASEIASWDTTFSPVTHANTAKLRWTATYQQNVYV